MQLYCSDNQSGLQSFCAMVCADTGNWYPVLDGSHGQNRAVYDQRVLLCLRLDLCADLVPVPAFDEDPMLYHLPNFQLGSFDDVFADDLYGWVLCSGSGGNGAACLACVGAVYYDLPGALLG